MAVGYYFVARTRRAPVPQASAIPQSQFPASFDFGTIWQNKTQRNTNELVVSDLFTSEQNMVINHDGKVSIR